MAFKDRAAGKLVAALIMLLAGPAVVYEANGAANAAPSIKTPSGSKAKHAAPVNVKDLQGSWAAIKQATWDKQHNKWIETDCAGSIALTRIAPGQYKFPGFNDILTGTTTSCSGVFKAAAMATSPGSLHNKPKPKPVRFQLQKGLLYEYLDGDHNARYTYRKFSDDPKLWVKI